MKAAASTTRERGVAALPVTLMLAFAVLLAVAYANRSVVLQVRQSVQHLHTAQAQEAAQAGLSWAVARLNQVAPVDDDCRPDDGASAWHDDARLGPLQASCVAAGDGWACHCPRSGDARPVRDAGAAAFLIELTPDATRADRWALVATGHGAQPGATARLEMAIGRLPALDTLPAAALTVRGEARFAGDIVVAHTTPDGGGVTVHSGGPVHGDGLRAIGTPGTPAQASIVSDDAGLDALGAPGLHASVFRMDAATRRAQPGAITVDCRQACDAALAAAARHHTLVTLEGGLQLHTPMTLGTPQRPLVLVVAGPVALHAALTVHGLVYLRDALWHDPAGASVHGAVIAEGELQAEGTTRIHHDLTVLQALQQRGGTHAPVAGSWRDL